EHPGPWPSFGLPHDIPDEVVDAVDRATAHGVRTQLIRHPLVRRATRSRRVYLAWTRPPETGSRAGGGSWVEGSELADLRALGALDWAALANGRRPGFGAAVTQPLLLVCTHGRRDSCCARYGRPAAVALCRSYPGVWETTHVGGDRFAANLVCLPHGTYHGQVSPSVAARVAAAALRGEIDLEHYRGRAGLAPEMQAAEWYARHETGERRADAVRVVRRQEVGGGRTAVDLAVGWGGHRVRVTLRATRTGAPRLTSCTAGSFDDPWRFELVSISTALH
ncbi:MAG: sucrase ferredoxin, partial [Carbonactinosporaceae bacterium]